MRRSSATLIAVTLSAAFWTSGLLPASGSLAQEPGSTDPHYSQVVQAYRGELTSEQIELLTETDPAPGLYLTEKTPAERAAARFFGSLPDTAHDELRKSGVLKWQVDRLPAGQRGWVREAARRLEARREGPFPTEGKTLAYTGFARVRLEGATEPQYCWWIAAEGAPRPVWVTLVRAIGLLTQNYSSSYAQQLPPLIEGPETPPIEAKRWVRIRTTPAKAPPPTVVAAEPLEDAEYFWELVKAYRGKLGQTPLKKLIMEDPLLAERLKNSSPATRALNELFSKLTDEELTFLLSTGNLSWTERDLTKPRRKLLEVILRDLNTRTAGVAEPYLLSPAIAAKTGFALVRVPGVEHPVISWWISSPSAPYPAWIPIANQPGVSAAGYYRSHLEQIPGSD